MPAPDPRRAPSRAATAATLPDLDALVPTCRACPRLVAWREAVAANPRASYAGQTYWGRPVPGFGPADARIVVVGLAPAAHGANRTGRMFTGDRSGDVLFAALHRAGLASAAESVAADDGLTLTDVRVTAPVRCAPPANRPTPAERDACRPFLARELELLTDARVAVVLGGFGWQALLGTLDRSGYAVPSPRPRFGHGVEATSQRPDGRALVLLGCYHVSQQNTFTGRLTPAMLDEVLVRARAVADLAAGGR
ncbi:MAG TPA: uracil-DNA glycosylase [Candidatus Nanopelagicales bacterium]|nr:uracil-DNA glycosylase [Candidatus Nanopelagicales bacterium]